LNGEASDSRLRGIERKIVRWFQLFFSTSASQASRIFFTSVADKHGFVRMIAPVGAGRFYLVDRRHFFDSIGLDGFGAKACGGSQGFSTLMIDWSVWAI
jgi:hypothetical protein